MYHQGWAPDRQQEPICIHKGRRKEFVAYLGMSSIDHSCRFACVHLPHTKDIRDDDIYELN